MAATVADGADALADMTAAVGTARLPH
jgi:hypothetical protein